MADKVKLILASLVLVGTIAAFYIFSEQVLLFRVIGLLVGLGIAAAIAAQSEPGAAVMASGRGAMVEIRKVVWPTRQETVQTTLLVMVMVIIIGLILWLFDMFLVWAMQALTGQGG